MKGATGWAWRCVLLAALLAGANAIAAEIDGYLGASFGMSAQGVAEGLAADGITLTERQELDGDQLIRAERSRNGLDTQLIYVFPEARDQLALVIEFFPEGTSADLVRADITERHGEPLSPEMASAMLEQMQDSLPAGVRRLTLWVNPESGPGRFVRLMEFDEHVAVEYLHSGLLSGTL